MKFKLNDYIIEYEIIRKKNKNLYFRFDKNSKLIITCPKYISDNEVRDLISKNSSSILKLYEKSKIKNIKYQNFYYLGNEYKIIYDLNSNEVTLKDDEIICKNDEELSDFIDKETLRIFNEEVEICKKCFNKLPDFTLKIRDMKSRWGVNNTRKRIITLNSELIKYRIDLIDYVIVHEMAHFYEGNHSKNFWKIVEEVIPDYKLKRKELRY